MSEQLNSNFHVVDTRLHHTNKIPFAVFEGGQSVNTQVFSSNSQSSNNINFNVQVPSENVTVDRRVMLRAVLRYTVSGPAQASAIAFKNLVTDLLDGTTINGQYVKLGWSHFPLHHHISSSVAQINNVSITQNSNDILDTIVRCLSLEDLAFNSESINLPDYYQNLNTISATETTKVSRMLGDYNGNVFKPNLFGHGTQVNNAVVTAVSTTQCIIDVEFREPLLMSPFTFDKNEHVGLTGVQNILLTLNLNPNNKRVFRSSGVNWGVDITDVSLTNVLSADLTMTFISPKPSEVPSSARSVVPYYEIRSQTKDLSVLANNTVSTYTSDSYQLPMIPDVICVYAKTKNSNGVDLSSNISGSNYGETYAKITQISVNFNNNAGLLSSCDQQSLYNITRRNCNLTFPEYSNDSLVGSFLAISVAKDLQVPDQALAPGSLGQFNIQYNVQLANTTGVNQIYTLYTVFLYRGAFATERGVSSSYLGLLDKEQVMSATKMRPVRRGELEALMGAGRSGGVLGMLASLLPSVLSGVSSMFQKDGSGMSGGASKIQSILDKYSS